MMQRLECRKHKGDMHVLARVGNIKEKTREEVDVLVRMGNKRTSGCLGGAKHKSRKRLPICHPCTMRTNKANTK